MDVIVLMSKKTYRIKLLNWTNVKRDISVWF